MDGMSDHVELKTKEQLVGNNEVDQNGVELAAAAAAAAAADGEDLGHLYHQLTGSFGWWQANATAFYFFAYILTTFNNLGYVFQSANTDHQCIDVPDDVSDRWSVDYLGNGTILNDCSRPCLHRIYNNSIGFKETIISKYDLICGDEWLRSFSQSIYQMGYVLSGIIISLISDLRGRKLALQVSVAFDLMGGLLLIFNSGSVYLYILSRLILGLGDSGRGMCLYMLIVETVGNSRRADAIMGCNFGWVIGYLLLPVAAYFLRDYVYIQIIPTAIMALMAVFWVPFITESPRWLLATGRFTEAERVLRQACKSNGRLDENFPTKFESIKKKVAKVLTTGGGDGKLDSKSKGNFWDLITDHRFRYITLILWFSFFANGLIYHGFSLNIEIIGGNMFVNFALAGVIEIPSVILSMVGLKLMGRRTFIAGAILLASVCYATVAFLRIWQQLSDDDPWLIALTMLGKMFIFTSFNSNYIHAGEIFPTQFRQTGVSSCSISARLGSTIAPFIKDLTMSVGLTNTIILFCSLSLAAAIGTLFLPETKNRDLVDTIN